MKGEGYKLFQCNVNSLHLRNANLSSGPELKCNCPDRGKARI